MKAIIKEGAFSLAYSITSRAGLLIANLITVKLLSVHDYGILSLYLTIVTSIATLSTFGLGVTCNKIAAGNSTLDPELVKAVVLASTAASIVLALLISGSYWPLVQEDYLNTLGAPLGFLSILFVAWIISATSVFEGTLFGTRNYRQLFNNALLSIAISTPLMGLAAKLLGIQGAIAATIFSRALMMFMHFAALYRQGWIVSKVHLIRSRAVEIKQALFQTSLPLALSGILAGPTIAAALSLVVDRHGPSAAGYFAWPYQIYLVATFVPGALGHFLTSRFSQTGNTSSLKGLQTATLFYVGLAVATCAAMLMLQDQILEIAGPEFVTNAAGAYVLFACCAILYGLNVGFIAYWTVTNRSWVHFAGQATWAVTLLAVTYSQRNELAAASIPLGFICGYAVQGVLNVTILTQSRKSHE